jgi:hypothetical protein
MPGNDGISDQDRDYIIRTVIGEAGDQPPVGQAAVTSVIMNRVNAGNYGKSPTDVVLAPSQFEPWQTRSKELMSIPTNSPEYQNVGKIVDGVLSGSTPDPTNGATHFLDPVIVRQRRGGTLPDWAQGQGLKIGAHTFFNPDHYSPSNTGTAMAQNAPDYLSEFTAAKTAPAQAATDTSTQPSTDQQQPNDYLNEFLTAKSAAPQAAVAPAANAKNTSDNGIGPPVPDAFDGKMLHITVPARPAEPANEFVERTLKPLMNLPEGVATVAQDYGSRLHELVNQAGSTVTQGVNDIGQNKTATGVGELAMGLLGYPSAFAQAVDSPITKMTGNPRFGELAAMIPPSLAGATIANAARPTVSALRDIVKDIGQENLPAVASRLESNPKLTLMDVVPSVRGNAAGLATDPQNTSAMNFLNQFQKDRMAGRQSDAVNIFEDALGPTPNMAQTIQGLKQKAADTGKNLIQPALENAAPIPVKSLTAPIDRMIGSPEAIAGETPRIPLNPTQVRLLNLRSDITSGEAAPLNERVKFAIDPVNAALKTGGMSEKRAADFTEARRLLNSARRGNTSEEDLTSGLKALAKKQKIVGPIDDALKMIVKGPTEYRSADFVHGLQSRLREEAGNLSKSATGSDRNMAFDLHNARDKLVGTIDKASGGQYRPALKQYANDKAVDEAFKEGFSIFSNPTGAEGLIANHPDMWKQWMAGASDAEKRAVAQGVLFGANNKIMNVRRGMDVPENSYAHQRIASVIGKDNADEIVRRLNDWRDIAETDNLLTKNSATAIRQAGQKARAVREPRSGKDVLQSLVPGAVVGGMAHMASGGSAMLPIIAGGTAMGAGKLANVAARAHDIAANRAYAEWAASTGQKKSDLIKILRDASAKANPASNSQKLLNLVPPALLQALPR